jgi:hypothetical protein
MNYVSDTYLDDPQSVALEVISADGSRRTIRGAFRTFASTCLTLSTFESVPLSTAVGVEYEDVLFLGDVRSSIPEAGGSFRLDIAVRHTLNGMQSLMLLRRALMGEDGFESQARRPFRADVSLQR